MRMTYQDHIPVTVLTGFLGAGKTTLLNDLLTQRHGHKCAIIINEFGAISIDNQLVVGADEEIVELNNGCLCCRVRGDLVKSLANLFQKRKRFDYVLIETTGLADPGPIAYTFRMSELATKLRLDAIVTVADAKHLEQELGAAPEATSQIGFADVILLNKTDLVSPADLERVEARIRRLNPLAKIHRTRNSKIDYQKIFNLKARDLKAPFSMAAAAQPADQLTLEVSSGGQEHAAGLDHGLQPGEAHAHAHNESVGSFSFCEERPLDLKKAEAWLGALRNAHGGDIYRSKGILHIQGEPKRVVFQGVQMMFDAQPERFWNPGEKRQSQLVFIGKELDETKIKAGFAACLAP